MGLIRMGVPTEIVSLLKNNYDIPNFIETGTYLGNTTYWASQIFKNVITIEFSQDLYQKVTEKYGYLKNVEFLYGHSKDKLTEIIAKVEGSSIFWLDAHWSGGETYGELDECPIIKEIEIINCSKYDNFILIDDARLFLSPPPHPCKTEHWPNVVALLNVLQQTEKSRYIVVFEDVIIAVPEFAKSIVAEYCKNINTNDNFKSKLKIGFELVYQGLKERLKELLQFFRK